MLITIPLLKLWEDAALRIGPAMEVVNTTKVAVWIPTDLVDEKDPAKLLTLLKTHNKGGNYQQERGGQRCEPHS